jgi:hypothetical protein
LSTWKPDPKDLSKDLSDPKDLSQATCQLGSMTLRLCISDPKDLSQATCQLGSMTLRLCTPEDIAGTVKILISGNDKLVRNASIHICHKYSGVKLKEIGQYFSVRESAITEASRRFQLKMEKDKELREMVLQVRGLLKI